MNRVINNPDRVVEDMLQGILAAHPELAAAAGNPRVIKRAGAPTAGKVGIVTGGGSGHEPAFLGYVGREPGRCRRRRRDLLLAHTPRASSTPSRPPTARAGVACLYGNYAGDNMKRQDGDEDGRACPGFP